MPFNSHAEYIAAQPAAVRPLLKRVQQEVVARVPGAKPCISYNMPAFRNGFGAGRTFFYFAAFKNHIGVYPPVTKDQALIAQTKSFRGPKGNLSFPYGQELPVTLIGRVAEALAAEYTA
jgi:uncharacterized protein YdhG (YjbR/CyaY superfamily)